MHCRVDCLTLTKSLLFQGPRAPEDLNTAGTFQLGATDRYSLSTYFLAFEPE